MSNLDRTTPAELPGLTTFDALATLTPADAPRFRLVVTADTDADGPIQWGRLGVVPLAPLYGGYLDSTPTGGSDPLDLASALERFGEGLAANRAHRNGIDLDAIVEAAVRWAGIFHGVALERWTPRGSSQSEWGDGVAYLEQEDSRAEPLADQRAMLTATLREASAWYAGDVYGVRLERAADFDENGGDAEACVDWQEVPDGALWGNYLVTYGPEADRWTAADVAAENFGVPLEFARAVPVVDEDPTYY